MKVKHGVQKVLLIEEKEEAKQTEIRIKYAQYTHQI